MRAWFGNISRACIYSTVIIWDKANFYLIESHLLSPTKCSQRVIFFKNWNNFIYQFNLALDNKNCMMRLICCVIPPYRLIFNTISLFLLRYELYTRLVIVCICITGRESFSILKLLVAYYLCDDEWILRMNSFNKFYVHPSFNYFPPACVYCPPSSLPLVFKVVLSQYF